MRYFDTAPWYGLGLSEHRVGRLLREHDRDAFVLSSKVGRLLVADPAAARDQTQLANSIERDLKTLEQKQ